MFADFLPSATPGSLEAWLIPATAVASIFLIGKKVFARKGNTGDDHITRAEFHAQLDAMRDRVDAMGQRFDAAITAINTRLAEIQATLARLDERTRPAP